MSSDPSKPMIARLDLACKWQGLEADSHTRLHSTRSPRTTRFARETRPHAMKRPNCAATPPMSMPAPCPMMARDWYPSQATLRSSFGIPSLLSSAWNKARRPARGRTIGAAFEAMPVEAGRAAFSPRRLASRSRHRVGESDLPRAPRSCD